MSANESTLRGDVLDVGEDQAHGDEDQRAGNRSATRIPTRVRLLTKIVSDRATCWPPILERGTPVPP